MSEPLISARYNGRTGDGMVRLHLGSEDVLLTASDATQLAFKVLASSGTADFGADFVAFLVERIGIAPEVARPLLAEFLLHRQEKGKA